MRRSWMVKNKLLMLLIATIALLWRPGSGSAGRVRKDPEDSASFSNSSTLPQQLGAEGKLRCEPSSSR